MSCIAQRRGAADSSTPRAQLKPVLNAADYLALLNQRLQAHPMYLEGMAFPVASNDEEAEGEADDASADEKLPLVVLVLDTRWDHFGVFASVIDEVGQSYELAPAASSTATSTNAPAKLPTMAPASPVACRQRLTPLGNKSNRLRQAVR